ncbi:MAG: hypothetical protein ACR2KQ_00735 [Actinomycetota bacterium]
MAYEAAGTVLLGGVFISAVTFLLAVRLNAPDATGKGHEESLTNRLLATVSFREAVGRAEQPLELEDDVFPTGSIWPLGLTLGITLVALGLQFGAWLWAPGLALSAASSTAWLTQLR